jgi:hypothetical protein
MFETWKRKFLIIIIIIIIIIITFGEDVTRFPV